MSTQLQSLGEIIADGRRSRIPLISRVRQVRGWLRSELRIEVPDEFAPVLARCESGAEARFLWEFCTRPGVRMPTDDTIGIPPLCVFPQYEWDRYRLDFYIDLAGDQLVVEIDGFGFHHRTPEQVEEDYARTRCIVGGLCPVIRFSAREVFSDAAACWRQVEACFAKRRANNRGGSSEITPVFQQRGA